MIRILSDFANFRRKNCRFSQKPMLSSLKKLEVVKAKTPIFAQLFGENMF
jgi:hypothetical protein